MKIKPKIKTAAPKKRKKPTKIKKQFKQMNGTSKLETMFEEILIELGEPYIHHYRFGNREFDFCLTEKNILIELHGCFFHSCPKCGKAAKYSFQKKSVKNDKFKTKLVKESNDYTLLVFWEHEVHNEKPKVIMDIIEALA